MTDPPGAADQGPRAGRPRGRIASFAVLTLAGLIAVLLVLGTLAEQGGQSPQAWFTVEEVLISGAVTVAVQLAVAWTFRRFGPDRYRAVVLALLAVWPVAFLVLVLDSATLDLVNAAPPPAGAVLVLVLAVGAPLVTAAGLVRAAAEAIAGN